MGKTSVLGSRKNQFMRLPYVILSKPGSILLLFLTAYSCSKKSDEIFPQRRNLTQAVYASGKILPLGHYKVSARIPGVIEKILVSPGQDVKAGDPLVIIRNVPGELQVNSAKNLLALAEENASANSTQLDALHQDVYSSRKKYLLDSNSLEKLKRLSKQNAATPLQVDQASTQAEVSRNQWNKATNIFDNAGSRLNVELKNARNQYRATVETQGEFTLLAEISGKVFDIIPENGELVGPQVPIMEIGNKSQFEVELSIDETDASLVQVGQEAVYSFDAFPNKTFRGNITMIIPRIIGSNKTVRVNASIEGDHSKFFLGMSVESNIIIERKKDILVIPVEYLGSNQTVRVKGKEKSIKVESGIRDLEYVEILSGISEKDAILKP